METLQNREEVALVFGAGMNDSSGVKRQRAAKPDNLNRDRIHPMKTYRIMLGKQPLAAVAATSYGQALAIAHATFPHLAHLPLVLKRI